MEAYLRETDRLEFYSDGVFAIAATLLCVDLRVPRPDELAGTTLLHALAQHWPSFAAFFASFFFIGIAWAAHHDMFHYIRYTNHILLMINLIFLVCIALQPFSTALLAEYFGKPHEHTAAFIYYGVLLLAGLSYNAIWLYASRSSLTERRLDDRLRSALNREYAVVPLLFAAAMVTSLWSVRWSLIPVLILYAFFALPRVTERFHRRAHSQRTSRNEMVAQQHPQHAERSYMD
jgi:uncharacterized membrane protein